MQVRGEAHACGLPGVGTDPARLQRTGDRHGRPPGARERREWVGLTEHRRRFARFREKADPARVGAAGDIVFEKTAVVVASGVLRTAFSHGRRAGFALVVASATSYHKRAPSAGPRPLVHGLVLAFGKAGYCHPIAHCEMRNNA